MLYLLQQFWRLSNSPQYWVTDMFGINTMIFYWICTNVGDALNVCCHSTFRKLCYFFILYFWWLTLWTCSGMLINGSTCIWRGLVLKERKICNLWNIFWNRMNVDILQKFVAILLSENFVTLLFCIFNKSGYFITLILEY